MTSSETPNGVMTTLIFD